jgi:hypothetical protein
MPNSGWEELYLQTVLETDAQKMQERIANGREGIAGRLRELEHHRNPQVEIWGRRETAPVIPRRAHETSHQMESWN